MLRDLLGKKIKIMPCGEMLDLFEKYYYYDNIIHQVIRARRVPTGMIELDIITVKGNSKRKLVKITEKTFKEKKFFQTITGLKRGYSL
jgi:hypothetical protein